LTVRQQQQHISTQQDLDSRRHIGHAACTSVQPGGVCPMSAAPSTVLQHKYISQAGKEQGEQLGDVDKEG